MIRYCVVLLTIIVGLCECVGEPPAEEEWVLNFDSPVYVCPDDVSKLFADTSNVEVTRYNDTVSLMRGEIIFLQMLESCLLLEMVIEKNSNGRVEVIVTHEICDFCSELGPESNYYKYFKYFEFPPGCPIHPGALAINDFVTEPEDLPVNAANEGSYQVTLNFYDNPECDCKDNRIFRACMKLDFLIEPL